jgi:hypothetical protein
VGVAVDGTALGESVGVSDGLADGPADGLADGRTADGVGEATAAVVGVGVGWTVPPRNEAPITAATTSATSSTPRPRILTRREPPPLRRLTLGMPLMGW